MNLKALKELVDAGVPVVCNQVRGLRTSRTPQRTPERTPDGGGVLSAQPQVQFSLVDRRPLNGMIQYCKEKVRDIPPDTPKDTPTDTPRTPHGQSADISPHGHRTSSCSPTGRWAAGCSPTPTTRSPRPGCSAGSGACACGNILPRPSRRPLAPSADGGGGVSARKFRRAGGGEGMCDEC